VPERLTIAHVITTTDPGGAETQLLRLIEHSPPELSHRVVSLRPAGTLAPAMELVGAEVVSLELEPGPRALVGGVVRLSRLLAGWRPDVVQTWLYHADLLGGLANRGRSLPPLVWGVRNSDLDTARYSRSSRLVVWACAALSRLPRAIVVNSRAGRDWHQGLGYPGSKMRVIPNGFDTALFRPDPRAREEVRAELGIPADAVVAGRVARMDPMKDTPTLLGAARLALARQQKLHVLLVGDGMVPGAPGLSACQEPPLAGRVTLAGLRRDVHRLYAAMDLHVSSSLSEGMPGAVGEAMASGLANLVTDAGDSARLVGNTGRVVEPGQPFLLGQALTEMAGMGQGAMKEMGRAARERIERHYAMDQMVAAYRELYGELTGRATTSIRSRNKAQSAEGQENQASSKR